MSRSRTISALSMMIFAGFAIAYDWLFIATVLLMTAGGLYEFFYLVKKKDIPIYSYVGIFIGLLIPVSIYTHFELTKMGDIGALLVGSKFGKHPLLPQVSPNKSIEGCLGSLLFSIVFAILFRS